MQAIIKNKLLMMMKSGWPGVGFFKPVIFVLCLLPFALLVEGALNDSLGPNPVETMIRTLGDWGIYFLLIGLAITPARKLFSLPWLIRYRRMLGLFAFFYVCMHFLGYIWFEQFFNLEEIVNDIIKRPFITVGFVCFLLLIPLAATSTNGMMRRLKQNWARLHKLVYPIAMLALLHYFMMIKADYLVPALLLFCLALLLGYRLFIYLRR